MVIMIVFLWRQERYASNEKKYKSYAKSMLRVHYVTGLLFRKILWKFSTRKTKHNDVMNLNLLSLGTLVLAAPCCVL